MVPAPLYLSIFDASGDSWVFEYIKGGLVIQHGKQYKIMTNSPVCDLQIGRSVFWPGASRAADRYARAPFFMDALPKKGDDHYIERGPDRSIDYQAIASVMGVVRSVSVPMRIATAGEPNIASTIWRSVSDQTNLNSHFDPATRPNTFWVGLKKLYLKSGVPARTLSIQNDEVFSGEVFEHFFATEPFVYFPAIDQ